MRALLQRVTRGEVRVDGLVVGATGPGLVVFLGVGHGDDEPTADTLARRIAELRIFADDDGRTNRSLLDTGGGALVVSQFTLYADTGRGRRPGFTGAAAPEQAEALYSRFCGTLEGLGVVVGRGRFGAAMTVELVNDGPFTIWLDTAERGGGPDRGGPDGAGPDRAGGAGRTAPDVRDRPPG
jgi:D-tyrosyl-tRNA(Tyr) deacylase